MAKFPSVQAIIPARGGSKGIPQKNLQSVGGVPLVGRAILAARDSARVGAVYVSTDDSEIKAVAEQYGAKVILRPDDISGDRSSSESAILHALQQINKQRECADLTLFIQCTSPFLDAQSIDKGIIQFQSGKYDSMFSACRSHGFLWRVGEDGSMVGVNHAGVKRRRRQDLDTEYLENGAFYLFSTQGFIKAQDRFFGRIGVCEMESSKSMEIDAPEDLKIAQVCHVDGDNKKILYQFLPRGAKGVVFDFDGVFTENTVYLSEEGIESVRCSRGDGMGIDLLRESGIPNVVISKERNPVVLHRCNKLKLEVFSGVDQKLELLKMWASARQIELNELVYLGNDVNDIECLKAVGCGVGVADSHPSILPFCKILLESRGGNGAIRELVDLLIEEK